MANVFIKQERLNGLELISILEKRSTADMLDTILMRAGVQEISEKELFEALKGHIKGAENLNESLAWLEEYRKQLDEEK